MKMLKRLLSLQGRHAVRRHAASPCHSSSHLTLPCLPSLVPRLTSPHLISPHLISSHPAASSLYTVPVFAFEAYIDELVTSVVERWIRLALMMISVGLFLFRARALHPKYLEGTRDRLRVSRLSLPSKYCGRTPNEFEVFYIANEIEIDNEK